MISQHINFFKEHKGCVTFPHATDENIKQVENELSKHGFADIPDGYKVFLKLSNGLSYNGVEFFGTIPHSRSEKNYTFPDLISENKQYIHYDFFKQKIIIGRISEGILLYDKKNSFYAIVDRTNLRSHIEVTNIEEFIKIFCDIVLHNYDHKK